MALRQRQRQRQIYRSFWNTYFRIHAEGKKHEKRFSHLKYSLENSDSSSQIYQVSFSFLSLTFIFLPLNVLSLFLSLPIYLPCSLHVVLHIFARPHGTYIRWYFRKRCARLNWFFSDFLIFFICLRHLFRSRTVTNLIFSLRRKLFSLTRAQHVLRVTI